MMYLGTFLAGLILGAAVALLGVFLYILWKSGLDG